MKNTETKYTWDETTKTARAERMIDGMYICGEAVASKEDWAYANEYTGYHIAECRMNIDFAKQHIEYKLKPQVEILTHVLGTMQRSPKYNPTSYEAKRIYAERQNLLDDIEQFKSFIAATKDYLNDYLTDKDNLYRRLEQGKID